MIKHLLLSGGKLATGIAIKKFLELAFDYILYPAALLHFGYLHGGIIMTLLAFIINFGTIKAYDWAKIDWLLIEKLKNIRESSTSNLPWLIKQFKPLIEKGDVAAFFVLCIDDPVTATLYLRRGAYKYNGLSSRDWKIFALANTVSNLYWIIGLSGIIEISKIITQI